MYRFGQKDWTMRALLDNILALYEIDEPERARNMLRFAMTEEELNGAPIQVNRDKS
jgi:hypothetical protein